MPDSTWLLTAGQSSSGTHNPSDDVLPVQPVSAGPYSVAAAPANAGTAASAIAAATVLRITLPSLFTPNLLVRRPSNGRGPITQTAAR